MDDPCAICLYDVKPPIGKPNTCEHKYCFQCLQDAAKFDSRCPICRVEFSEIHKKERFDGPVTQRITVPRVTNNLIFERIQGNLTRARNSPFREDHSGLFPGLNATIRPNLIYSEGYFSSVFGTTCLNSGNSRRMPVILSRHPFANHSQINSPSGAHTAEHFSGNDPSFEMSLSEMSTSLFNLQRILDNYEEERRSGSINISRSDLFDRIKENMHKVKYVFDKVSSTSYITLSADAITLTIRFVNCLVSNLQIELEAFAAAYREHAYFEELWEIRWKMHGFMNRVEQWQILQHHNFDIRLLCIQCIEKIRSFQSFVQTLPRQ